MRRTYNSKSTVRGTSKVRDAYGFEVPQNLVNLYAAQSATWSEEEKKRTDKWLQFLKDISPADHRQKNVIYAGFWDNVLEESLKKIIVEFKNQSDHSEEGERLEGLIRIGVPSFLRGYLWRLFLTYDAEKTPGLFNLLSRQASATKTDQPESSSPSGNGPELERLDEAASFQDSTFFHCEQTVDQINKDLDRTFPGHPLMDTSGKDVLREILVAFSLHRPDIGYCQGMNFITGLLLLFHKPEDAFWNLSSIIEHLLPNQFDRDMLPAVVDKLVFSHLVRHHFPELAEHLEQLAVDVSYLCPHWFLCCFVNALPMETCLRVWDMLFWERKPNVLFKVALALVDFYSEELMETQCAAAAWEQLQVMAASFLDSSRLIETAYDKFDDVDEECISELRTRFLNRIKEQSMKDLLGQESQFSADESSLVTTPTKILASSQSIVRNGSVFSSDSSNSVNNTAPKDQTANLTNVRNLHVVRDIMSYMEESKDQIPADLTMKIYDLVDRLVETESHGREIQSKLDISCKEISKANETNRCLKSRLGAVYAELDKKNEGLDRMIAKCQILTEKVASQEETICKQKRVIHRGQTESPKRSAVAKRGTKSMKNLFSRRS